MHDNGTDTKSLLLVSASQRALEIAVRIKGEDAHKSDFTYSSHRQIILAPCSAELPSLP